MIRADARDRDINHLNITWHIVGAIDFEHLTWEWVDELLGARPPYAQQQGAQRNESFSIKVTWLRDRVRHMSATVDAATFRQYTRCYIMLLIGGYLMTDKSNNQVYIRWLPLLADFERCHGMSWDPLCLHGRTTLYAMQHIEIPRTLPVALCSSFRRYTIGFLNGVYPIDRS
ncbi:hypothetical protein Ahy_B01g052048 [Arachis hypogaea]|uniref:Aminotransferase-like plant mobile domain-containing protein n=1 Tax=Arachis hypogaea TaxID=3818 RepID=A0A445ANF1_ARAHY|nr:hypothetical protein Ahy_B01g052048 [Arachis hypogaea]